MIELVRVASISEIENNIFLPKKIDMLEIGAKDIGELAAKLKKFYQVSKETWLIRCDNKVIGVYGIREENEESAIPWALLEEVPKGNRRNSLQLSYTVMNDLKKRYKVLHNVTSTQNVSTHKWLKYLGFTVFTDTPIVISAEKSLYNFEWRKETEDADDNVSS